jgi:CRISPR/Cas system-associated protein Cas10 (large subunit of type III CRISPR-Cas system)
MAETITKTKTVSIEYERKCEVCGNELFVTQKDKYGEVTLLIEPCKTCIDSAYERGATDTEENE